MFLKKLLFAALAVTLAPACAVSSPRRRRVRNLGRHGCGTLNSITYSGTARNGRFGQSKSIGDPMGPNNLTEVTEYTRTLTFETPADPASLVSRATGLTQPLTVPGVPAPEPGVFNQNITAQQAGANWNQALNIWTTPWGFLKGADANLAMVGAKRRRADCVVLAPWFVGTVRTAVRRHRHHQRRRRRDARGDTRPTRGAR